MKRRTFLAGLAAGAVAPGLEAEQLPAIPIIDTHIHLFDPTRPQGAPYSGPKTPGRRCRRFRRAIARSRPARRRRRDQGRGEPVDRGQPVGPRSRRSGIRSSSAVVGNLEPEKPEFAEYLGRYHKNPLFRGIRCGNLWGRDFTAQVDNPGVHRRPEASRRRRPRDGHGQPAPVAAPGDRARHRQGADAARRARSPAGARALRHGARPRRARRRAARARRAPAGLREAVGDHSQRAGQGLDRAAAVSQPARPADGASSARIASSSAAIGRTATASRRSTRCSRVAKEYFATQPRAVAEKYFWKNSIAAYKWVKRDPSQPSL